MKILFLNPPDENKVGKSDEQGDEYIESDDFGHFPPRFLYVLSSVEKNVKGS